MKMFAAAFAAAAVAAPPVDAGAEEPRRVRVAPPVVQAIAPALADYTDEVLFGDLWERDDLSPRDRSLVTITALIAGGHVQQMSSHFNRALDNGLTRAELSGVITHLAFYAGWPRAMSAVTVADEVFKTRDAAGKAN